VNIESRAILDNGVTCIVTTLRTAAQLNAVTQDINNLALLGKKVSMIRVSE
jgi:hypothetical protein